MGSIFQCAVWRVRNIFLSLQQEKILSEKPRLGQVQKQKEINRFNLQRSNPLIKMIIYIDSTIYGCI